MNPSASGPRFVFGPGADSSELPAGAHWHAPASDASHSYPESGSGSEQLANAVAQAARELGFARVGFVPIQPFELAGERLRDWLAEGYHGTMGYLATGGNRADPRALLPQAKTLVVVALSYTGPSSLIPLQRRPERAEISRYARGQDYHALLKTKLRQLADRCANLVGRPILARACTDTAPLLEREAAARAGIGFTAKSTLTIAPGVGSYVLLGELLVDLDLSPSTPINAGCGSCRRCLDACPTQAFVDAYVLDARRCISYLTIEFNGIIPRELRRAIGTRVFGCDVCQEVCPYNASAQHKPGAPELEPRPELEALTLVDLLNLSASGYRRLVKHSAMNRTSRERLARNAAVALGNANWLPAVPHLIAAALGHRSLLVRGHAVWALGNYDTPESRAALERVLSEQSEPWIHEEARLSLENHRAR